MKISSLYSLVTAVVAIVPEAIIAADKNVHPGRQSLPNLFTVSSANEMEGWEVSGSLKLDAGRLAFEQGLGALWSKQPLANSMDEWVIEAVFRNSESVETADHSFVDSNGLSFWLLQAQNTPSFKQDKSNFGGPAVFDGFQFLVNNKEKPGLKLFSGDGTRHIPNQLDNTLGTCLFNYLDSMVPFTLRISYSAKHKWFKVQIDNNLCFKTDAISFKNLEQDFDFGVTGSVDGNSKEYWEILKMSVYNELTEDAIDDHAILADGAVRVVTVTQQEGEPTYQPSFGRESLMERTRKWKEQMQKEEDQKRREEQQQQQNQQQQQPVQIQQPAVDLSEVTQKLNHLESLINQAGSNNQPDLLILNQIVESQIQQIQALETLKENYHRLEQFIQNQNHDIAKSILNEFNNHKKELGELGRHVQSLAASGNRQRDEAVYLENGKFESFLKWIMITMIAVIVIISVFVYRIRKDVKHSKLL